MLRCQHQGLLLSRNPVWESTRVAESRILQGLSSFVCIPSLAMASAGMPAGLNVCLCVCVRVRVVVLSPERQSLTVSCLWLACVSVWS